MFSPAPPVAPTPWQAAQLRSLKIGPRPSPRPSLARKFALAAAKVVELVPGSASPSAACSLVWMSMLCMSPQPAATSASAAADTTVKIPLGTRMVASLRTNGGHSCAADSRPRRVRAAAPPSGLEGRERTHWQAEKRAKFRLLRIRISVEVRFRADFPGFLREDESGAAGSERLVA